MKVVPFYGNSADNMHCLQACIQMLLTFYFPKEKFSDLEIDRKTLQEGGHTWFSPAVTWLDDLGLRVELYCSAEGFDYRAFAQKGDEYLKETWSAERYQSEKNNGALKTIDKMKESSGVMVSKNLWIPENLTEEMLSEKLKDTNTLAVGKTFYEWLANQFITGTPHYVLIQKKYSPVKWSVHDPGLPPIVNRKVPTMVGGTSIFGDVMVVYGLKE